MKKTGARSECKYLTRPSQGLCVSAEFIRQMTLKCADCGYEPRQDEVSMRSLPKCPKCGSRVFIKVSMVNPRVKTD